VPPTVVATTTIAVNRRLGRGGIGDVYTASDRATGRSLAVKFLNDWALEQESCREAFAFEALITSQEDSPVNGTFATVVRSVSRERAQAGR